MQLHAGGAEVRPDSASSADHLSEGLRPVLGLRDVVRHACIRFGGAPPMIYLATVYEWTTYDVEGSENAQRRVRHILVSADDSNAAWIEAKRTAEVNATFGPRLLSVEVMKVGSVALPAEVTSAVSRQGGK